MMMERRVDAFAVLALLLATSPSVIAQNVATVTQDTTLGGETPDPTSGPQQSSPTPSDDAPGGNNNNNQTWNSSGLVKYYFVFIALILCVVALGVFLTFRQRRIRAIRRMQYGREDALQRDLGRRGDGWSNWNPERARGRYWQGRWRSAEVSREEGLNELGEPPPAYLPKRPSEDGRERNEAGENEPAIPLQTLSRQDAGLKPPDYTEVQAAERDPNARISSASASSSGNHESHSTT